MKKKMKGLIARAAEVPAVAGSSMAIASVSRCCDDGCDPCTGACICL